MNFAIFLFKKTDWGLAVFSYKFFKSSLMLLFIFFNRIQFSRSSLLDVVKYKLSQEVK